MHPSKVFFLVLIGAFVFAAEPPTPEGAGGEEEALRKEAERLSRMLETQRRLDEARQRLFQKIATDRKDRFGEGDSAKEPIALALTSFPIKRVNPAVTTRDKLNELGTQQALRQFAEGKFEQLRKETVADITEAEEPAAAEPADGPVNLEAAVESFPHLKRQLNAVGERYIDGAPDAFAAVADRTKKIIVDRLKAEREAAEDEDEEPEDETPTRDHKETDRAAAPTEKKTSGRLNDLVAAEFKRSSDLAKDFLDKAKNEVEKFAEEEAKAKEQPPDGEDPGEDLAGDPGAGGGDPGAGGGDPGAGGGDPGAGGGGNPKGNNNKNNKNDKNQAKNEDPSQQQGGDSGGGGGGGGGGGQGYQSSNQGLEPAKIPEPKPLPGVGELSKFLGIGPADTDTKPVAEATRFVPAPGTPPVEIARLPTFQPALNANLTNGPFPAATQAASARSPASANPLAGDFSPGSPTSGGLGEGDQLAAADTGGGDGAAFPVGQGGTVSGAFDPSALNVGPKFPGPSAPGARTFTTGYGSAGGGGGDDDPAPTIGTGFNALAAQLTPPLTFDSGKGKPKGPLVRGLMSRVGRFQDWCREAGESVVALCRP